MNDLTFVCYFFYVQFQILEIFNAVSELVELTLLLNFTSYSCYCHFMFPSVEVMAARQQSPSIPALTPPAPTPVADASSNPAGSSGTFFFFP